MKTAFFAFVLVLLFSSTCLTDELMNSERSPSGLVLVDYFHAASGEVRKIFLRSSAAPSRSVLLTTFERNARVLFSPDEKFLVLNDEAGSNVSYVRLFRKEAELTFKENTDDQISTKAWQFLRQVNNLKKPITLIHMYAEAMGWSDDSSHLVLKLSGYTDSNTYVSDWYCIYSVAKNEFSQDLAEYNAGQVRIAPEKK